MEHPSVQAFMAEAQRRNPNEPEFLQAVEEVAETVIPFIESNPKYQGHALLERMIEPERVISFRVPWTDDAGKDSGQPRLSCGVQLGHWALQGRPAVSSECQPEYPQVPRASNRSSRTP